MKVYFPGLAENCRKRLADLLPGIQEVAREHGYAVALHGSVQRDIDLIAAPWTNEAWEAEALVEAIRKRVEQDNPIKLAYIKPGNDKGEDKPHGRRAWSIHIGAGVYIDLSVMPLRKGEDGRP